jgi:RNA polymerase sigma factor (sigma-70 family)
MSQAPGEVDDAKLMQRIALTKDLSALTELMTRHAPKITGHLRRRFRSQLQPLEIDDAVNKAAMKIWNNADRFKAGARFGPWFLAIAHNTALDILKAEKRRPHHSLDFDPEDKSSNTEDELDSPPDNWRVEQLEHIVKHELTGFEQVVALADMNAGGSADTQQLMRDYGKTKNVVQATRSKVRKKIRELITARESVRDLTKVKR